MSTAKKKSEKAVSSAVSPTPDPTQAAATPTGKLQKLPGASVSRKVFRRQAKTIYESAVAEKPAMEAAGMEPQVLESLNQATLDFDAVDQESAAAKGASKLETQAFKAAVAVAFAFRVTLVANIRLAARKKPEVLQSMPLKLSSARSADSLVQWFNDTQGTLEQLREELAAVSTVDWIARLQAEQQALLQAIGVHEQQLRSLAALEDKRVVARNNLVGQMEDVRAYAGVAFARQPNKLKLFGKGYGSKKRSSEAKTNPASPLPAAPSPAAASTVEASLPAPSPAASPAAPPSR